VNQIAKDEELLNIAKDYFRFVTKFFEVIDVSAPHIYHSALELCPTSSIIRKLYYHRRITHLPKVVIGTPDLWDSTIAISGNDYYNGLCAWSPCGQFVAAQTWGAVEIRDQLTLELVITLQPSGTVRRLTGPLSYSPDGHSIACASDTAITIWDIQTGGVAKEIGCSANTISLVWSSDGQTLCTIDSKRQATFVVHTYDVSSGTTLSSGTLQSADDPHVWTYDESFRVMTTVRGGCYSDTIDIFEVGSTLIEIQSFFFPPTENSKAIVRSFSPTTYRISISDGDKLRKLRILDIRDSKHLLDVPDSSDFHAFSSDGSRFTASGVVWTYASGCYRDPECPNWFDSPLQFSPTSSSILGHCSDILLVCRLHKLPAATLKSHRQYMGLSRSGARIAIASELENTVTILDVLAQTPPQFIDTGLEVVGLALTGNVLLVMGSEELVAWLLTEEGLVDGVIGNRRVDRSDSIWAVSQVQRSCAFWVGGHVGVIKPDGGTQCFYHTETGEALHPTQVPQNPNNDWYCITEGLRGWDHLFRNNSSQCNTDSLVFSPELQEGWVKDLEGRRWLRVPIEWRMEWDPENWYHDVAMQLNFMGDMPLLIKF